MFISLDTYKLINVRQSVILSQTIKLEECYENHCIISD